MELKTYIDIILRRWKIVLGTFIILMTLIVIITLLISPKYASSVSLRVLTPRGGGTNYVNFDIYYANRLMNTYVSMATSSLVIDEVMKKLNLAYVPDVKAEIIPDTELVRITVKDSNPTMAVDIANTLAVALLSRNTETANNANIAAEDTLNEQLNKKKEELGQARNTYKSLIGPNSQNTGRITNLTSQIQGDQSLYVALYDRYENGRQNGIDQSILSSQAAQLSNLQLQVNEERTTLEGLNTKAAEEAEQIRSSLREVTLIEQEYSTLVTQLDQVRALQAIQGSTETLIVIDHAYPARKPVSPNYLLFYSIGLVFSLFLAVLAAFIIDNLNTKLSSAEQIQSLTRIPLLGRIRRIKEKPGSDTGTSDFDLPTETDLDLHSLIQNRSIRSLMVTSIDSQTNSALNCVTLAKLLAKSGIKTIILDANLELPSVHFLFPKISNAGGLSQVLTGKIELEKAIKESGITNLSVLPAGKTGGFIGPAELKEIIEKLLRSYSMVVVNPSFANSNDVPEDLVSCVDGMILLIDHNKLQKQEIKSVISRFRNLNYSIIGFIDYQEVFEEGSPAPLIKSNGNEILTNQNRFQQKLKFAFSLLDRNSINKER